MKKKICKAPKIPKKPKKIKIGKRCENNQN